MRSDPASVETLTRLFAIKNTMGYGLNSLLDHDDPVEMLVHLAIGSEGTLGFVASAVFRTVEVLPQVATGLLVFADLHAAAASVEAIVATGVATAELLDAQSLRVAQADPKCPPAIRGVRLAEQAALLVELQAREADELAGMQDAAVRAFGALPLETDGRDDHRRQGAGRAVDDPQGPLLRGRRRPADGHERAARGRRRTGARAR